MGWGVEESGGERDGMKGEETQRMREEGRLGSGQAKRVARAARRSLVKSPLDQAAELSLITLESPISRVVWVKAKLL